MKITPEFLNKYNKTGPRYTSYPPATSFSTKFTTADFIPAVIKSNGQYPESISIYIHIPFCPQLCHFVVATLLHSKVLLKSDGIWIVF